MYDKAITYDRTTRDYRMELDGRLIGYARNHHEAEVTLDQTVFEMLTHGDYAERGLVDTLPTLDEPVMCGTCDGEGRIAAYGCGDQAGGYAETCPDCDGRPRKVSSDELAVILKQIDAVHTRCTPPESLRQDCLNVITMALGQTNGASSIVAELRRVKARLEAAALINVDQLRAVHEAELAAEPLRDIVCDAKTGAITYV